MLFYAKHMSAYYSTPNRFLIQSLYKSVNSGSDASRARFLYSEHGFQAILGMASRQYIFLMSYLSKSMISTSEASRARVLYSEHRLHTLHFSDNIYRNRSVSERHLLANLNSGSSQRKLLRREIYSHFIHTIHFPSNPCQSKNRPIG